MTAPPSRELESLSDAESAILLGSMRNIAIIFTRSGQILMETTKE